MNGGRDNNLGNAKKLTKAEKRFSQRFPERNAHLWQLDFGAVKLISNL